MKNIFASKWFYYLLIAISIGLILNVMYNSSDNEMPKQDIPLENIPKTQIRFSKKKINFGNVPNDTVLKANFVIYNMGTSYLKIISVNPDCSCTNYHLSKDSVQANDSTLLTLIYNTHNKIGPQELYTVLEMNTEEKLYMLTLKANVIENK